MFIRKAINLNQIVFYATCQYVVILQSRQRSLMQTTQQRDRKRTASFWLRCGVARFKSWPDYSLPWGISWLYSATPGMTTRKSFLMRHSLGILPSTLHSPGFWQTMKHIRILILKNRKRMEIFDRNPCDTISYEVHECRKLHNTWIHGVPSSTSTASIKLRILQRTVHVTCLGKHEKRIKVSWGKLYGKRRRVRTFKTVYSQMFASGNGDNFITRSFTLWSLHV